MEKVADTCLRDGDVEQAYQIYTTMENINPRCSHMARLCRALCDPISVPLPFRHNDVCEALLDFHFTAEILVGNVLSIESIQKKYQRLVVFVHPDKNPNPRAVDAFLRLAVMKEEAKDCLSRKIAIKKQQEKRAEKDSRILKKKKGSGADVHCGGSALPNLADLKSNKITLRSLKRKNIEESFEIFSCGRGNRFKSRYNPFEIADIDEENMNSCNRSCNDVHASLGSRTHPLKKRRPSSDRGHSQFLKSSSEFTTPSQSQMSSSSKMKVNLAQALEEARHYLREEEEAQKKQEERQRAEQMQRQNDSLGLLQIRNELTSLIDNMEERRKQHIELHTDLSYSNYLREQKMGPKPQAFVIVQLQKE